MKKILIILILATTGICSARTFGEYMKNNALSLSLTFTSGALNGYGEVLQFHYSKFEDVHPHANAQFWDPDKSWTNKYKGHEPENGEKFPLSSSWLVFTTDGYHAIRMAERISLIASISIPIDKNIRSQMKFSNYLFDFIVHWFVYELGFIFTYGVIYR